MDEANTLQAAAPAAKTLSQVLGETTWLMTQSPLHRQLFVGDLEWFCMPALLLEQFRVFHGPGAPAAIAFWARVSADTQARLMGGADRLQAAEWTGGEHPWLIDLVAPFGGVEEILADISRSVFPGEVFLYHRTTAAGREVAVYPPAPTEA